MRCFFFFLLYIIPQRVQCIHRIWLIVFGIHDELMIIRYKDSRNTIHKTMSAHGSCIYMPIILFVSRELCRDKESKRERERVRMEYETHGCNTKPTDRLQLQNSYIYISKSIAYFSHWTMKKFSISIHDHGVWVVYAPHSNTLDRVATSPE